MIQETNETVESRSWLNCGGMSSKDRRNVWLATLWLLLWMAAFVAASLFLKSSFAPSGWLAYGLAMLPTGLGVWALFFYIRFLRNCDELYRKIQVEALAFGFGAGLVAIFAYALLERVGAPPAGAVEAVLPMVFFYMVGQIIALRRYA